MRVLGFDPGTATTGFGLIQGRGTRLEHIEHGVISTSPNVHFAGRLKQIYDQAANLIAAFNPDAVGIEKLYFKQNVTTGLAVAEARGVIALAVLEAGLPIGEFSPLDVKKSVTGYGRATKRQIQEMIKILLGMEDVPRPDDAADALGIAICQYHAGASASRIIARGR